MLDKHIARAAEVAAAAAASAANVSATAAASAADGDEAEDQDDDTVSSSEVETEAEAEAEAGDATGEGGALDDWGKEADAQLKAMTLEKLAKEVARVKGPRIAKFAKYLLKDIDKARLSIGLASVHSLIILMLQCRALLQPLPRSLESRSGKPSIDKLLSIRCSAAISEKAT